MVFVNDRNILPWKTIDKEQGVFLVCTHVGGGASEKPDVIFDLQMSGRKITFFANKNYKKNENGTIDVNYQITNLNIPKNLEKTSKEIHQIIEESLKKWGLSCDVDIETNVIVNF